MNKTITINISGVVFHIDELAYEKLKNYLSTIKSYYSDSEARAEIMADIEARIAEIFQSKLSDSKQALLMKEVDEMIEVMGNPEVFKEEESSEKKENAKTQYDQRDYRNSNKRLFRDPDERVFGGVCSGIGNYFGFDPVWLRGLFAISFFVFGTGLLIYLLLWLIVPKAKTTAEKLEMRGEKVNIENIEKSIRDEFESVKNNFKNYSEEAGTAFKSSGAKGKAEGFLTRAIYFFGNIIKFLAIAIAKVAAVFASFIGVILVIVILAFVFGTQINVSDDTGITTQNLNSIYMLVFNSPWELLIAKIGLVLLFGVPLLLGIYSGIKFLLGIKTKQRLVNIICGIATVIGAVMVTYTGISLADDFSNRSTAKEIVAVNKSDAKTLYLDVNKELDEDNDGWKIFGIDENKVSLGYARFTIEKSETDSFELSVIKMANGSTKKIALGRANNIDYNIVQNDTVVAFDPYFTIDKNHKWRNQRVKVVLKVPVGKSVYLSGNMENFIYDIKNVTNTWDGDMINRTWTMTSKGLECIGCKDLTDVSGKKRGKKVIVVDDDGKEKKVIIRDREGDEDGIIIEGDEDEE